MLRNVELTAKLAKYKPGILKRTFMHLGTRISVAGCPKTTSGNPPKVSKKNARGKWPSGMSTGQEKCLVASLRSFAPERWRNLSFDKPAVRMGLTPANLIASDLLVSSGFMPCRRAEMKKGPRLSAGLYLIRRVPIRTCSDPPGSTGGRSGRCSDRQSHARYPCRSGR